MRGNANFAEYVSEWKWNSVKEINLDCSVVTSSVQNLTWQVNKAGKNLCHCNKEGKWIYLFRQFTCLKYKIERM